jgi:hypothetical protein
MVHLRVVSFDMYSSNSSKGSHFGRSTGAGYEDQVYDKLSKELQSLEASRGCQYFTIAGPNLYVDQKIQ